MNLYEDRYNCTSGPPYAASAENTYRTKYNLSYPVNVARNIAREAALTHYILASDIVLYPSEDLINKFLKMVTEKQEVLRNARPKVFALPVFEILDDEDLPKNKTELLKMIANEKAFPFQVKLCRQCYEVPFQNEWLDQLETEAMDIFPGVKRRGQYKYWESFYIGTNGEPLFDERLISWGEWSDKITQVGMLKGEKYLTQCEQYIYW